MSNGFCQDHCQGSYVFAIIQGQNCWCSNEQPANTVSNSQCSDQCPGYPSETCGNVDQGLFAYFNLGGNPTGTYGGSSPSSSASSSSVSTYTQPATVTVTPSSSGVSSTGRSRYSWTLSSFVVSVLTSDVISQSYTEPSTSSLSTSTVSETKSLTTTLLSTSLLHNFTRHILIFAHSQFDGQFANMLCSSLIPQLPPIIHKHKSIRVLYP